ncbi:uncharacterized protein LAESUDRAFT_733836 [Laetiporus sulphureus 93-53]|uniref:F-box domain-containing protein n=1 Tax=Laetiporus sulphureus 93-53 TaxID=1314785 RepID=A0A165HM16_9APHY|nr:uncharacterized protein LAESUDRAFT_733836 [Laetiporus sulphureus 93-53]KZT11910.1 hypothetical protein LAESUDRAFT_733836 [Laetiporus sulphureus 93-53]
MSIPHLREALHCLESKMASLLSERDILESSLEQAVRMQSPIHRLPEELLSAIFEIGVFDAEEEDSATLFSLMLVSRGWRDVALHTPGLWSRIAVGTRHSLDRARLRLERSKSVPLHVCIDFSPRMEYGSVTTESIVHAMDQLRSSIWRWKTFHLIVPNCSHAHATLTRCREQAPALEMLSVRIRHSMQEDRYSTLPFPLFNGRTPRLRSCSFTSFHFNWDLKITSKLRVLKLGGYWNGFAPSVDRILDILRACPQLEELALRNMSDIEADPTSIASIGTTDHDCVGDTKMVHLPRLTKASFYYSGNNRTRAILSFLSFPTLERMELCFLDNVSPMVEQLRRQSQTRLPLRHLRIEASYFNELKLLRVLRRLPALTTLEFVDVEDVSSNFLKNLATPASTHTWTCPKLTHLCLEGCTSLDWESLRSFVESRLPAQPRALPCQAGLHTTSSSSRSWKATSSASASAYAAHAHTLSRIPAMHPVPGTMNTVGWPHRLASINLTRCHQISKEMVQWLRLYVAEVKCETTKGIWGEVMMA